MIDAIVEEQSSETQNTEPLGRIAVLGYGAGHMLNDITSSCWFTYLLLFLTELGLSPRDAAIVMLSGQVADALTTIFSGELIDRFGHFKLWHAGGSILVAVSFSSVFGGCVPCEIMGISSAALQTIGYSLFAAIFNVGWAVTQVSHMSMVNCITLNPTSRVSLTSCRNAFTMVANLSLYALAFVVFSIYDAKAYSDIKIEYRWIAYLSIFIGCCFVIVFLICTKEPELTRNSLGEKLSRISWNYWFKKTLYFQVALVYVLTRLITNVSQALLAFFVIDDLGMPQSSKALVPAIIYICSFIVSVILQEVSWTGSRLKTFFISGAILWIFSGSGIFVLPSSLHNAMYIFSISIGIANALMMVTGISMQSMLVGKDLNGCGFVYGSLSFLDKLSCGLALYALESYQDLPSSSLPPLPTRTNLSSTPASSDFIPSADRKIPTCTIVTALPASVLSVPPSIVHIRPQVAETLSEFEVRQLWQAILTLSEENKQLAAQNKKLIELNIVRDTKIALMQDDIDSFKRRMQGISVETTVLRSQHVADSSVPTTSGSAASIQRQFKEYSQ